MKRLPHRPPPWYIGPRPEPISDRYQTEIDAATNKLERAYRNAGKRANRAERRVETARASHATSKAMEQLERELEARINELRRIEALMQPGNIAQAAHRGSASYRKVPGQ